MNDVFVSDVVFDEPIPTGDGVALGGHHTLTVKRDGSSRYKGHLRATGMPSFDVSIVATLGYPIPVPDSSDVASGQVAFAVHGRVHGSNEPGSREFAWDQSGESKLLASVWSGVRRGSLNRKLEYDTDWFGPAGDVASFFAQVLVFGAVFGSAGTALVVLGEAADQLELEQVVLPGTVGLIVSGGAAFVLGPGALIPAFLVGAAVTAAAVKQRRLEEHERAFAHRVFLDTVPYGRILLTNLLGIGNRPFTTPGPGGVILVNVGEGYADPVGYTGKGRAGTAGEDAPGQLFIHELVHAWQIANESFTPEYYCRALFTAAGTVGGDMSAYAYAAVGRSWESFGTEEQAKLVDEWFAGNTKPKPEGRQSAYPPKSEDEEPRNPYYRYIRDNIRTGIA
ncbi:MAG: hypothetical protein ABI534_07845 [Chloroflexota bacterium]